jgi:curved DNA-binding protein CbpA
MYQDFYELFSVEADATEKELKKAHRLTIRELHPDLSDSDEADKEFKAARKAFAVLEDPDERKKYDKLGHHKYVAAYMDEELISVFEFEEPKPDASRPEGNEATRGITTKKVRRSTASQTDRWKNRTERTQQKTRNRTHRRTDKQQYTARPGSRTADIHFRPKVRRDILTSVVAIAIATILYVVGLQQYILNYEAEIEALFASLKADSNPLISLQSSIQEGRFGIPTPVEYIRGLLEAPAADPLGLLLPVGMVLLPLTLSIIVYRFGDTRTWWYVVGVLTPLFAAAFNVAGIPLTPHIEFLPYVAIPIVTAVVFFSDIVSHILSKFLRYYGKKYNIPKLNGK